MKKFILLLFIFYVGVMQKTYCQDEGEQKSEKKGLKFQFLTYYAFGGINASSIVGDDDSYKSGLIGFEAGVGGPIFGFGKRSALGAELMYGTRGSKYDDSYVGTGKVVTSYMMVPVFFRYMVANNFYGEAGLQPSFLLSAKDKYDGGSYNYKNATNSFDLPVFVGAGIKFTDQFGAGIRYSRGVTNIVKSSFDIAKDYNSAISLRLMVAFGKSHAPK